VETRIRFEAHSSGPVHLAIRDAALQPLATLVDEVLNAGVHERLWDGTDGSGERLAPGPYWAILTLAEGSEADLVFIQE
jgi:hypothetical protein